MTGTKENKALRSVYPAVIWITLCVIYVAWSYKFNETSRTFPLMAGYLGLVLGLLDLTSRFDNRISDIIRVSMGAGFSNPEMSHNPAFKNELIQAGWMIVFVLMVLFIGILPAVPIYVMASMRINGDRSWKESLIASAATLLFVYVVFEVFLDFDLYRGVLFDERGFDRW